MALTGLGDQSLGIPGDPLLDGPALAVAASSSPAISRGAASVGGEQQLEPRIGAIETAGGVDSGRKAEAESPRVDAARVAARHLHQCAQAELGGVGQRVQAIADEAAILAQQRNEIGDGGERDKVEVLVGGRSSRGPGPACRPRRCRTARGTDTRTPPGERSRSRAAGRRRAGRGGRVTTTSIPAARACATSSTAVMPQSTVISSPVPRSRSRSTVAAESP